MEVDSLYCPFCDDEIDVDDAGIDFEDGTYDVVCQELAREE